jgi:hypothetical protein
VQCGPPFPDRARIRWVVGIHCGLERS